MSSRSARPDSASNGRDDDGRNGTRTGSVGRAAPADRRHRTATPRPRRRRLATGRPAADLRRHPARASACRELGLLADRCRSRCWPAACRSAPPSTRRTARRHRAGRSGAPRDLSRGAAHRPSRPGPRRAANGPGAAADVRDARRHRAAAHGAPAAEASSSSHSPADTFGLASAPARLAADRDRILTGSRSWSGRTAGCASTSTPGRRSGSRCCSSCSSSAATSTASGSQHRHRAVQRPAVGAAEGRSSSSSWPGTSRKTGRCCGAIRRIGPLRLPPLPYLLPMVAMWAIALGIVVVQRDLGAALLFFCVFLLLLYVADGALVSYVIGGLILFVAGSALMYQLFDTVQVRVDIWLDPFRGCLGRRLPGRAGAVRVRARRDSRHRPRRRIAGDRRPAADSRRSTPISRSRRSAKSWA